MLIKEQDHIYASVGGLILFGKNRYKYFPDAWIQAGRFNGDDKSDIIDNHDIKEHLPIAVEESIKFIQKHIQVGISVKETKSHLVWSIPRIAIREAIINAIVHCDYSLGGAPIRVSIFDNRVEIENPGLLPIGLTIDDIISGVSKIRNRIIARVFHELHLVGKWGSGIQRMTNACIESGLPAPKLEEIGTHFRVALFKQRINPAILDKVENKIIEAIKKHGLLSTQELSEHVGLSSRSIRL